MSFNSVGIVLVAAMLVKMSNAGGSSRGFVYSERDKVGYHDLGTGYRSYMIVSFCGSESYPEFDFLHLIVAFAQSI